MRKIHTHIVFLLAVSLFSWNDVHAQTDKQGNSAKTLLFQGLDNDSILSAFSQRFVFLDSLVNQTAIEDTPYMVNYSFSTLILDSIYDAKQSYERKAFKRKNGLELTGQVYQRLDNKLGFDEDTDQYSRYNAKLQGEIGWNFFNSSFLQRKSELQFINLSNRAEYLRQQKQQSESSWIYAKESIESKYNQQLNSLLHELLLNINVLNMAYQFVLENDRTDNEKMLDAMNEKMRIEHALTQTESSTGLTSGTTSHGIETITPKIIEVDSTKLFAYILSENTEIQVAHMQENMLAIKRKLTNYAHEMRFTPFVRASHYLRTSIPSSTNVEAGIRFTFPLYDDTSAKRKALQSEKNITALNRVVLSESLKKQCLLLLSRLNKLNKSIETEQQYTRQLRRFIEIRKEAYLKSLNGYNHIARLEEYNQFLKSLERMYNLLQLRDLCLLDIQKTVGCADLMPMIIIKDTVR